MFSVINEYAAETASGAFESVIIAECETEKEARRVGRKFATENPDASVLVSRGRGQGFDASIVAFFTDEDSGKVIAERA